MFITKDWAKSRTDFQVCMYVSYWPFAFIPCPSIFLFFTMKRFFSSSVYCFLVQRHRTAANFCCTQFVIDPLSMYAISWQVQMFLKHNVQYSCQNIHPLAVCIVWRHNSFTCTISKRRTFCLNKNLFQQNISCIKNTLLCCLHAILDRITCTCIYFANFSV